MRVGATLLAFCLAAPAVGQEVARYAVTGDAVEAPLAGLSGDAARGARIVRNRETANCLICHTVPDPSETFMGEIGPPLAGVASRLSAGQIRLRLIDPTEVNPTATMPAYHRIAGLVHVEARYRGRPVLSAQEIEDVVAYLSSLKE
ncbi:sulfur oxidation c-type cytochrome SoxX [Phreatobacter sp.]|uniref:sulfur oxidation c-type cytochrome SoxX n=1 Tax=Phreatobacter sp. TaxID=1966341 RepID=UPI0025E3F227|nr:sulfur oxidation c-type cytochrome SoxX [Phreatobacter sp.]